MDFVMLQNTKDTKTNKKSSLNTKDAGVQTLFPYSTNYLQCIYMLIPPLYTTYTVMI